MDRRETNHQWYDSFDPRTMTITFEVGYDDDDAVTVPAKWDVCDTCDGRGTHVNPSIDSHGLSAEDFADDPDFAEDYFSGAYDQPCNECHGRTTVPVVDEDRCTPEQLNQVNERIDAHYAEARERAAEMRWGY